MRLGTFMALIALVIVSVAVIIGCDDTSAPIATAMTNNPALKVDFLFEHDGCKVYPFTYKYSNHYYANCSPGMLENPQGKSQTDDAVSTAQ